jgi:ketosteroid isomerase-like protein
MTYLTRIFACLAVLAAVTLSWNGAAAHDASAETEKVLGQHLKAFGEGNVAAIMADYSANAVLITPGGALRGHDQIRPLFEGLVAEFGKPGASFAMAQQIVDGNMAYIVWSAETADNVYELGTDTFVVRNGKIVQQTFAGKITSK